MSGTFGTSSPYPPMRAILPFHTARACVPALLLLGSALAAQTPRPTPSLDIYFIDTEGGQATLYVAPSGESLLVDTGNPGARDNDRIVATLADAGIRQLDHLLITHYHGDHVGGVQELARRIPIRHYIDHGPTVERTERGLAAHAAYAALHAGARHTVVRPGDRVPILGVEWRIVSAGGKALTTALPGGGRANPSCGGERPAERADDENAQSTGSVITFGRFRTINLGDLLTGGEFDLMCPVDRIGPVDLYLTSHHGLDTSGSEALVHALRPRVAIMNNGTRKGGSRRAFQVLHASPGLEDLWQLHWSHNAGVEHNAPGLFVANMDDAATLASVLAPPAPTAGVAAQGTAPRTHDGPAYLLKVTARVDGSFTVINTRNGFSKTYRPRI